MALTKPLVVLADVMSYLPVRSGNDAFDERISMLIDVATAQIETATSRLFTQQTHIEYFRTVDTASKRYDFGGSTNETGLYTHARSVRYVLKGIPISATADFKVFYDTKREFAADTEVPAVNYILNRESGVLTLRTPMREGENFLKVSYTAGYATDPSNSFLVDVPADLRLACVTQTIHLFGRLTPDNIGVDTDRGSKSVDTAKFTRLGGLTVEAASMVSRYRQPLVGLY